jgi:hypothetical protein
MRNKLKFAFFIAFLLLSNIRAIAQSVPANDRRLTEIRHLDLTYSFPVYRTREEWVARAEFLRGQILASAGLWPMPPKPPIRAEIFGRVDRGDYTIEKVYFESYPGHYVTGNLYRPKNPRGKVPAILNPHGHWLYGRLENTTSASIPIRAANFAQMGMVAFTYDMVGYDDSQGISHRFAPGHRESFDRAALWSVNLLGLQLWNSIRALDFLLTLPEVDPARIGCTGASGGGTQTFLLAAVDDRVKVAAPVNMISSIMQGGSLCENAPNLRIDTNNMELGALLAPRPMIMVSATGDWTKNTLTVEYPAIRNIYRLLDAEANLHAIQITAPHNYNQASREAGYSWFAHHFLGRTEKTPLKEQNTGVASLAEQIVFYGRPRPNNELDENGLIESLIASARQQFSSLVPKDATSTARFRETYGNALKYSLMVESPSPKTVVGEKLSERDEGGALRAKRESLVLSRSGRDDRVEAIFWTPAKSAARSSAVLVVMPPKEYELGDGRGRAIRDALLGAGHPVLSVRGFDSSARAATQYKFFTTYNRTDEGNRVQDILTALAYLQQRSGDAPIKIVASGQAGLWTLFARAFAPSVARVAVDVDQFDNTNDEAFLRALPIPGIRRAGDFTTAIGTGPSTPLLIHNTGQRFRIDQLPGGEIKTETTLLSNEAIISWLLRDEERR